MRIGGRILEETNSPAFFFAFLGGWVGGVEVDVPNKILYSPTPLLF